MAIDYAAYYWQNDRIRLRAPNAEDAQRIYESRHDTEAMKLVQEEVMLPPSEPDPDEKKAPANNQDSPNFTIETLSGDYVGSIGFNYINARRGTFSIGIYLVRGQRGKGYGRDAMDMLMNYAFNERRMHKFDGYCVSGNKASAKMMMSLGCKLEGICRDEYFMNGTYMDRELYGATIDDYSEAKKR